MPKILFRGTSIRYVDMRMKDGIIFSRLHLTSELTRPLAEEQGWTVALETDGWDSMKLSGEVRLTDIRMKVSGLTQELSAKADEARDFEAVRVETETGAKKVELRFLVITPDHPALIYEYWKAVGTAEASLSATLQDEAQRPLPLGKTNGKAVEGEEGQEPLPLRGEALQMHATLASKSHMERAGK